MLPSQSIVTETGGEWQVPAMNCADTPSGGVSIWVGVGGFGWPSGGNSGVLLQTGIRANCVNGAAQYAGWFEEYPSSPNTEEDFVDFPVSAGDSIEASVYQTSSGAWETCVQDATTGRSGLMVTGEGWGVSSGGCGGTFSPQGSTAGLLYSGGYTAEWIVEDYTEADGETLEPFADYGSATFTNLTTSLSQWSLGSAMAEEIVQSGTTLSTPSQPSGSGFTVSYTGS